MMEVLDKVLSAEELKRRKNAKIRKSKDVYKTFHLYYQKNPNWDLELIE